MVWIVEWSKPCESENSVSLWDTEEEARKNACESIQDAASYLDLYESEIKDLINELNGHVMNKDWKACMEVWSDWQENQNEPEYYAVYQQAVLLKASEPVINAIPCDDEEDDEEENDLTLEEEDEIFQATSPGATCRGPCKNYSPYAYADQRNGTFHCCQCKTFGAIFGTNKTN